MIMLAVENRFARLLDQMDADELKSVASEYLSESIYRKTLISYLDVDDKLNVIENFPDKMKACEYVREKTIETLAAEKINAQNRLVNIDKDIEVNPNKVGNKTMRRFVLYRLDKINKEIDLLQNEEQHIQNNS